MIFFLSSHFCFVYCFCVIKTCYLWYSVWITDLTSVKQRFLALNCLSMCLFEKKMLVSRVFQISTPELTSVFRAERGTLELRELQGNTQKRTCIQFESFSHNYGSTPGYSSCERDGWVREREFVIIHINYGSCDMGMYIARMAPLIWLMEPPSGPATWLPNKENRLQDHRHATGVGSHWRWQVERQSVQWDVLPVKCHHIH